MTAIPNRVRWKGRAPTWKTYSNSVNRYRLDVLKWVAAGKPEEELPGLAKQSQKCDAIWLYLTTGQVLPEYGIAEKPARKPAAQLERLFSRVAA